MRYCLLKYGNMNTRLAHCTFAGYSEGTIPQFYKFSLTNSVKDKCVK